MPTVELDEDYEGLLTLAFLFGEILGKCDPKSLGGKEKFKVHNRKLKQVDLMAYE